MGLFSRDNRSKGGDLDKLQKIRTHALKSQVSDSKDDDCPFALLKAKSVQEWRACVTETLIEQHFILKNINST